MTSKLQMFWAYIKTEASDLWSRSKMWLIALASLLLYLKWGQIKEYLIVKAGNKEIQNSNEQDQTLATQEKIDSDGADALVKASAALSKDQPTISPDWYKDPQ